MKEQWMDAEVSTMRVCGIPRYERMRRETQEMATSAIIVDNSSQQNPQSRATLTIIKAQHGSEKAKPPHPCSKTPDNSARAPTE